MKNVPDSNKFNNKFLELVRKSSKYYVKHDLNDKCCFKFEREPSASNKRKIFKQNS